MLRRVLCIRLGTTTPIWRRPTPVWQANGGPGSRCGISSRSTPSRAKGRSAAPRRASATSSRRSAIRSRRSRGLIGKRLIERSRGTRPLALTPAGEILLAHADALIARVRAAQADLAALDGDGRCGAARRRDSRSARTARAVAPRVYGAPVSLHETSSTRALLAALVRGELDLALSETPLPKGPLDAVAALRRPVRRRCCRRARRSPRRRTPVNCDGARAPAADRARADARARRGAAPRARRRAAVRARGGDRRRPCRASSPPGSERRSCRGSPQTSDAPRPMRARARAGRGRAAQRSPRCGAACSRRGRRGGVRRGRALRLCRRAACASRCSRAAACRLTRVDRSYRRRRSTSAARPSSQRPYASLSRRKDNPRAPLLHPPSALGLRAVRRGDARDVRDLLRHPGRPRAADVRAARDAASASTRAQHFLGLDRPVRGAVRPVPRPARRAPVARALVHEPPGRDAAGAAGGARHRVARLRRRGALADDLDPDRDPLRAAPALAARPNRRWSPC